MEKKAKGGDKEAKDLLALAERSLAELREGRPARAAGVGRDERHLFQSLGLLSSKPVLYVCNVEEASADKGNAYSDRSSEQAAKEGAAAVVVSAKIESEIAVLPQAEQKAYLEAVGLERAGAQPRDPRRLRPSASRHFLHRRPEGGAGLDGREGRQGARRRRGVIHTDFEKGFIRAETIAYDDYVAAAARRARAKPASSGSKARTTSVADGDVLHFRFAN